MRDLIKIIIALFFISGAYFLGTFQSEEKLSNELNEMKDKLKDDQVIIGRLKDSITSIGRIIREQPDTLINNGEGVLKSEITRQQKKL